MTDLTLDALVEDLAETLWQRESVRATEQPRRVPWFEASEHDRAKWRDTARVALAAVAKAAGGADVLRESSIVMRWTVYAHDVHLKYVAALLSALAEAARDE